MKHPSPDCDLQAVALPSREHSRRFWWGAASLAFLCFCPTCKQAASTDTSASAAVTAAPSASVATADAKPAAALPGATCTGKYQGEYTVSVVKSDLTKKDGAPEQWEKDDGKNLAGKGTLTLQVDAANAVSGTAEGALGQQSLRGACDENTLRVQLDSPGDEPNKIRNAYLLASISGSDAVGTLAAATGDSLIRRAGPVTLHRTP